MTPTDNQILADRRNHYPPWTPRIWTGIRPRDYWRLLTENRFRIHPTRYAMTGLIGCWCCWNSILGSIQQIIKGKAIFATPIQSPPIFIVGHWRSGTTLLHELISLDRQLASPQNYDTFAPHHFLVSGPLLRPLLKWLIPRKRPMDDMTFSLDSPQEDEFALLVMGASSPYRRIAFPNNDQDWEWLYDADNLSEGQREVLHNTLQYFVRALTYKYGKRLVLKSPPHTGRIKLLNEWFPGAKFIHISRHPYQVVPSTMRLWKITDLVQAFQKPRYTDSQLLDYVNRCQQILYGAYYRDRSQLSPQQIVEVKFEQLKSDPLGCLRTIYDQLELDGVETVLESAQAYFELKREHHSNRHQIGEIIKNIDQNWSQYMHTFDYFADSKHTS